MPLIFVETSIAEQRVLLCRYADLFFSQGRKTLIVVDSTQAAQFIDHTLWTHSQSSFVPHAIFGGENSDFEEEPVLICIGERRIEGFNALLCDAPLSLEFMARFETAVHFVLKDDPARLKQSRALWQRAKESGLNPVHKAYETPF